MHPRPDHPDDASSQRLSDADQNRADADQTTADTEQTLSDLDQSASERDQRAAERDQRAADADQADADLRAHGDAGIPDHWADGRRTRSQTALDRAIAADARRESALARDVLAARRDGDAEHRDRLAAERDALAARLDREMAALEQADEAASNGEQAAQQALRARRNAAAARDRAAAARDTAARDRAAAAADRRRAAEDRDAARDEMAMEGIDHLTGALRRVGGLEGVRRELQRTRRTGEPLTVAFIDVDGLKAVNDTRGHADGDAVLKGVVDSVKRVLRGYDLVTRYGGDEFVCVLSGRNMADLRDRFDGVAAELAAAYGGASITVGFATAHERESPEELIVRADQAMMAARSDRRQPPG
jgi:diguanylate cyclase (GGDEF)-like protein